MNVAGIAPAPSAHPASPGRRPVPPLSWLFTLLALAFALFYGWHSWRLVHDDELKELGATLALTHRVMDQFFARQQQGLQMVGGELRLQGRLREPGEAGRILRHYHAQHQELLAVHLLAPDGRFLASTLSQEPALLPPLTVDPDLASRLHAPASPRDFYLTRPHTGPAVTHWHFGARLVLRDARGKAQGLLIFVIPLDLVAAFWQGIPAMESRLIGVLRDDAYLLSRYPLPQAPDLAPVYGQPRGGALRQHLLAERFPAQGQVQGYNTLGRTDYIYLYQRLEGLSLTVYAGVALKDIRSAWWQQARTPLLLLLFMTLVGLRIQTFYLRRKRLWRQEREQAASQLQAVIESATDAIISTGADHRIVLFNPAAERLFGYRRDAVVGRPLSLLVPPQWRESHDHSMDEFGRTGQTTRSMQSQAQITALRADGRQFPIEAAISHATVGGQKVYTVILRDISERLQAQRELELSHHALEQANTQLAEMAHYDALTGLPNRALLADRMRQALAQGLRRGRPLAVAFLDLDGFKAVNDRHGHAAGDQLLVTVARRLQAALREGDTLARLGGDEFVALLLDLEQPADLEPVLQRMLQAVQQPVLIQGEEIRVSTSIGVTRHALGMAEPDQLIRLADQAMYQAKQAGKNRWHYGAEA